jgi:hypothetical protein
MSLKGLSSTLWLDDCVAVCVLVFDWSAVTLSFPILSWADACGMSAVATEVVASTESAAISVAVVFRDNIDRVDLRYHLFEVRCIISEQLSHSSHMITNAAIIR